MSPMTVKQYHKVQSPELILTDFACATNNYFIAQHLLANNFDMKRRSVDSK